MWWEARGKKGHPTSWHWNCRKSTSMSRYMFCLNKPHSLLWIPFKVSRQWVFFQIDCSIYNHSHVCLPSLSGNKQMGTNKCIQQSKQVKIESLLIPLLPVWFLIFDVLCIHKVAILLFQCGDLVSLITFEGTILYQAVSCFSGKKLPLVFQSVMYLYFKKERGK